MKYIKKFEDLDFSQTLPFTSKGALTSYYSCDECDHLWKSLNKQDDVCKFCESDEIEELSSDEWHEMKKSRLDDREISDLDKERSDDESYVVDLYNPDLEENDNN